MHLGTVSLGGTITIPAFKASATAITYTVYGDDGGVVVTATAMDAVSGETDCYLSLLAVTSGAGFEAGKQYSVLIEATVGGSSEYEWHTFHVEVAAAPLPAPLWSFWRDEAVAGNRNLFVEMVSAADYRTRMTGLTVTATWWKPGAAEFAAIDGSVAEVGYGSYKVALAATDLDTEGFGLLRLTASGAADRVVPIAVLKKTRLFEVETSTLDVAGSLGKLLADDLPLLVNRLGAFTGTGVETVLGFLNALANSSEQKPSGWTDFQSARDAADKIGSLLSTVYAVCDSTDGIVNGIDARNPDVYNMRLSYVSDDLSSRDEYTVAMFCNGAEISEGTAPSSVSIKVYKRADGTLLIPFTPMSRIGSTPYYRYDAAGAQRLGAGEAAVVEVIAQIDGVPTKMVEVVGRHATA